MNNCMDDSSKRFCTGCGACIAACKHNAIQMLEDNMGFVMPFININCKNCGICKDSCYKYEDEVDGYVLKHGHVLAASSNSSKVKLSSSSGGIAYEIATYAIEHGYEVWGVKYDYERKRAYHDVAYSIDELSAFQGSKYIQSDTSILMKAIKNNQIADKALITGTPCQIYSLSKLKGDRKWVLIDIFCSGVPTYLLWDKYVKYISDKYGLCNITNVKFRDKKYGWHGCQISITDDVGTVYSKPATDDLFYAFFLSKKLFRDSCFDCQFKLQTTYADLRIGDFWGKRFSDNDFGISLVIANTKMGEDIISALVDQNAISAEEAKWDEALEAQQSINRSRSLEVDSMREMLEKRRIYEVYKKYIADPYYLAIAKRIYHLLPDPIYRFLRRMRGLYK